MTDSSADRTQAAEEFRGLHNHRLAIDFERTAGSVSTVAISVGGKDVWTAMVVLPHAEARRLGEYLMEGTAPEEFERVRRRWAAMEDDRSAR